METRERERERERKRDIEHEYVLRSMSISRLGGLGPQIGKCGGWTLSFSFTATVVAIIDLVQIICCMYMYMCDCHFLLIRCVCVYCLIAGKKTSQTV